MKNTIYFDMDGTIADFYNVPNWLNYLENEDVFPYETAKPLLNFSKFARKLNKLQKHGYKIGIISWCSKKSTKEYEEKVKTAKIKWLKKHLPSVKWDIIKISSYGVNKWTLGEEKGILFDDEEKNLASWQNGNGYPPSQIFNVLDSLA